MQNASQRAAARTHSKGLADNFRKYWPYYVMAMPGVIYLIIFRFIPMLGSVIAFEDYQVYTGIFSSQWVGMKNFVNMFTYSDFSRILTNTLILGALRILFCFPVPVIMALMMNEIGAPHLKKTIQTAVYIPYFLSWIIVSELIFENCRVPKSNLIGQEGRGFMIAMSALDGGRIGMGAQAVGVAEGALDAAVKYSGQRVQFGKPINANQGIQWYLADMATTTEAAKLLVWNAANLLQNGFNINKEAAMAKYYASENAVAVCNKALQIHGGYGYMKDYAIERMYRDARIIPLYEGTSEVQKMVISRAVIK